jgi:hypothetical protein
MRMPVIPNYALGETYAQLPSSAETTMPHCTYGPDEEAWYQVASTYLAKLFSTIVLKSTDGVEGSANANAISVHDSAASCLEAATLPQEQLG